jgi:hypothetical protein
MSEVAWQHSSCLFAIIQSAIAKTVPRARAKSTLFALQIVRDFILPNRQHWPLGKGQVMGWSPQRTAPITCLSSVSAVPNDDPCATRRTRARWRALRRPGSTGNMTARKSVLHQRAADKGAMTSELENGQSEAHIRACRNPPWVIIDPVNAARFMTVASTS